MIFITVGSQKFQFDRLLKKVDKIIEKGYLKDKVFAQTGYCNYKPKYFKYKEFLNRDEFDKYINECEILLTHGGTGAIIGGVKKNKKVIAIPRNKKFGEHVDNHQYEIVKEFYNMGFIYTVENIENLYDSIKQIKNQKFKEYKSNTKKIIDDIDKFISEF